MSIYREIHLLYNKAWEEWDPKLKNNSRLSKSIDYTWELNWLHKEISIHQALNTRMSTLENLTQQILWENWQNTSVKAFQGFPLSFTPIASSVDHRKRLEFELYRFYLKIISYMKYIFHSKKKVINGQTPKLHIKMHIFTKKEKITTLVGTPLK